MDAVFIYRDRPDDRFYDASTGEMRGGPDKAIVYFNGFLFALDRKAKIAIPVSRWKLAEIGLGCVLARSREKAQPLGRLSLCLPNHPKKHSPNHPRATESPEARWEHLMQEMRDLSR